MQCEAPKIAKLVYNSTKFSLWKPPILSHDGHCHWAFPRGAGALGGFRQNVVLWLGTAGGDPRLVGALLGSAAPTGGDGVFFNANKRGLKWIEPNKRWGM